MEYCVWAIDSRNDSFAWVKEYPETITKNQWKLDEGVSCVDWFPESPEIQLCDLKGVQLTDAIPTYGGELIVSGRLQQLLKESGADFEFFPVTILDKKGRACREVYYMANLLDVEDCVDMDQSEFRMDALIKDQVDRFAKIVFDEKKMTSGNAIFRLKVKTNLVVLSISLARKILDSKCSGVGFVPLGEYGKFWRGKFE